MVAALGVAAAFALVVFFLARELDPIELHQLRPEFVAFVLGCRDQAYRLFHHRPVELRGSNKK